VELDSDLDEYLLEFAEREAQEEKKEKVEEEKNGRKV
jgi:hypothetical protein